MLNKDEFSNRISNRIGKLKFYRENLEKTGLQYPFFTESVLAGPENTILLMGTIDDKLQISLSSLQFTLVDNSLRKEGIALIDLAIDYLIGKSREDLMKVSWRELESYLRDSNSIPSVPKSFPFGEEEFMAIKESLCLAIYMGLSKGFQCHQKVESFKDKSYIGQI